ncbi:MAG: sensor histidine kinase [Candidatus Hodarchaeota archaeon]
MTDEILDSCITTIKKNFSRLELLIDSIIEMSEIEHGIHGLTLETVDFRYFMKEIQETYENNGIKFFQFSSDTPIYIDIDAKNLRIVLNNLIDNAIKQTISADRMISVSCKESQNTIQMYISDNGIGIIKENLEKIFDKFVSIPTEYAVDETGISLYVVRQIIRGHGGTIRAESPGVGQGSTFTIQLPRIQNRL